MDHRRVWDSAGWEALPALAADITADACVVGLGGSGLACIHELLDLGRSAVGIDASGVAAAAAGSNGGFLLAGSYHFYHDAVAHYGRDRALRIYQMTREQIDRIEDESPEAVRRVGSLRIATSDEELDDCEAQFAAMCADRLDVERYDGPEGRGLLFPADCAFDPLLRCRLLARQAIARGASLFEMSPAVRIESGLVTTAAARIACDVVFVATDGAILRLVPGLAGRVRIARLQMLATQPTDEVRLPRPVYARYGFEYWQQLPDGRIALGGFRDRGGPEEWTDSTDTSPRVQQLLEQHLREVIGVHAPIAHRWAASVGFTADGLPILEEVAARVWAFGGYSGTGNAIGAICGRGAARAHFTGDVGLVTALAGSPFTTAAAVSCSRTL
ncbi:FAD-dependent oxidoreductase [soil metagenome]